MKKINRLLTGLIAVLTLVIVALVGVRVSQSVYEREVRELEEREQQFEAVYERNAQAQSRVQEMQQEIRELQNNKEELHVLIDQINSGEMTVSDNQASVGSGQVSGNLAVSGNQTDVSGNRVDVSGNSMLGQTVSANVSVSGNMFLTISGQQEETNVCQVSDNLLSLWEGNVSGNDVSGNREINYYDPAMVENSIFDPWRVIYVQPEMTLEERRQYRTSLEETLEVNQADRECLAESTLDFSGKKIACLGDSITAASNLDNLEDYQQYSYPTRLKELLGAEEVTNLGIGGSSIGRYWADAFADRYQEIPEDTDIILVMGGTNDGFCVSEAEFGSLEQREARTFCGDLDELMRGIKENYPDAMVFFATPLPNILHDYLRSERSYLLPQKDFADVILTLADEYGFQVVDLYNSNILDSHDANIVEEYMPDGVHCNPQGYQILAEHFAAEIVRYDERRLQTVQ